ncbi:alpha-galactosidase [Alkalihalophilus sp. As8PL]|uniref:Alpha-galactosidase n=1 Tax=Alkalihalophilus sp. As8PL TaxID=3237103 RepID=A0AB39BX50_9BACI
MPIIINQEKTQFHLTNGKVSYIINKLKNGHLGHLYFGKALRIDEDYSHFQITDVPTGASCHTYVDDPAFSLETVKQEYPVYGTSDFREPALSIRQENGSHITDFKLVSYKVTSGKKELRELPSTFVNEEKEASTLELVLEDTILNAELTLIYTIFEEHSIITRSAKLKNNSDQAFSIERMMSASIDFPTKDLIMTQLSGTWARERHIHKRKLEPGIQAISSLRGASSHHHNPFMSLQTMDATEHQGEVYGFNLVYSGNFLAQVEVDHYEQSRVSVGIHPTRFEWNLSKDEVYESPEVVMTYSDQGLNGMSQSFHKFYQEHLIAPYWRNRNRPILINNWEATYFDFNEEKLVSFAKRAKELGIELFVLDDGWFGQRNDDTTSLGDWGEDRSKLPEGLESLSAKVRETGLEFGLWFEPEMVSPNSELNREYPDWAIGTPGRERSYGRNQFVLDFTRKEIVDYIYEKMSDIIERTQLSYIKWDMNRNITEAYSRGLAVHQQDEFFHRYLLGVYDLYKRLTTNYPHVLFESCAGGGGRFDPGMFRYAPQAWASDDTDAMERLKIQYGSSLVYPLYSIGSHVSAVPNHQTLRSTPLETRANVAYFGTFGYELNPQELSQEEEDMVKAQISNYKTYRHLIRTGEFYRLQSPFESNETAWMVVSQDRSEALVGWYKVLATPNNRKEQTVRLKGLIENASYQIEGLNRPYYGDELMNRGIPLTTEFNGVNASKAERGGDFQSNVYYLKIEK